MQSRCGRSSNRAHKDSDSLQESSRTIGSTVAIDRSRSAASDSERLGLGGNWNSKSGELFEAVCQTVDQLGVAGDLIALAPAGHVGHREAGGVEAEGRADAVGDALGDDLLAAVGQ